MELVGAGITLGLEALLVASALATALVALGLRGRTWAWIPGLLELVLAASIAATCGAPSKYAQPLVDESTLHALASGAIVWGAAWLLAGLGLALPRERPDDDGDEDGDRDDADADGTPVQLPPARVAKLTPASKR